MQKHISIRFIGAVWGVVGILVFLGYAVYRLSMLSMSLIGVELTILQLGLLVAWTVYMIYTEGIKAFGKQFSPRVAARAQYVAKQGTWLQIVTAPVFCFGYYHSTKKRLIVTYCLTVGIILLIILIRFLPQPWRAIIDAGAAVGIAYGTATTVYFAIKAWKMYPTYVTDPCVESATKKLKPRG